MNFLEAVEAVKNPNDKFNLDLIAIRVVILELLKRTEPKPVEVAEVIEEPKKGKKK